MSTTSENLPTSIIVEDANGEQVVISLSSECDAQASFLLTDPNYMLLRQQSSQFCRLKTQNALANCCNDFSYELGMFYDCQENCVADCTLQSVQSMCDWYAGRTCKAKFMPTSGNPSTHVPVQVMESVCIPSSCDNDNDRDILFQLPVGSTEENPLNPKIYYYPTHLNVEIECESGTGTIIGILVACLLSAILLALAFMYLFVVPKTKQKDKALQKAMNSVFGEESKNAKPAQSTSDKGSGEQGKHSTGSDVRLDVKGSASIDSAPQQSDSQDQGPPS